MVVFYVILELREETWAALVIQTRWRLKVCIKPLNCVFTRPPCIQIFVGNMSQSHFVWEIELLSPKKCCATNMIGALY